MDRLVSSPEDLSFPKLTHSPPDMWREIFVWCLVSSLVIHFVSGLLAWYSLGGHPIAMYALPSFIIAGFFTPLFAGTITSKLTIKVFNLV